MLEYFTSKKVKKHREEKSEKKKLEKEDGKEKKIENGKGKGKEIGDAAHATTSTEAVSPMSPSSEIVLESVEGMPILDQEDQQFLERLTSPSVSSAGHESGSDDETPPPLPPRVKTPVIDLEDSDASSFASRDDGSSVRGQLVPTVSEGGDGKDKSKTKGLDKDKEKDKSKHATDEEPHKPKRFSFVTNLSRNISLKRKPGKHQQHLTVPASDAEADPAREVHREETDIERVLGDMDLAASTDSKAFSLSRESAETLRRFTQVLRDLVNGVPTAYGDLVGLIEDRDGALGRAYEKLPRSLKKLVARLPEKLTSSLAPELLAVAAEAQGLSAAEEGAEGAAKKLLSASNLMDLITKPGAVVGLLKGIVNALKVRWPAFIGTNVLWSVAVFLLLSALWYCYKRGRETRLEREASDAAGSVEGQEKKEGDEEAKGNQKQLEGVDNAPRLEELLDEPQPQQLTVPVPASTATISSPSPPEGK
ncbi:hypothetical protein GGR54DRAFT_616659 [Hypoxylon sp. NC1633]|nr:hypothetical protein GGR54DRAFT_616659 [Hypoxylon sp. NC1633]